MAASEPLVPASGNGRSASLSANGTASHRHVVQFYESEHYMSEAVSRFVAAGLVAGEPVVVIATPERRSALSAALASSGLEAGRGQHGRLTVVDARSTLSQFMVDDMPDPARFRRSVGGVFERCADSNAASMRAYGEMVDVLWRDGMPTAALRLEELWNELAESYSFSLLCAYALGNFCREADVRALEEVCRRHTHVIPAESFSSLGSEDARGIQIALLQQRARALEHEIAERERLESALREALADARRGQEALQTAKDDAERASRVKTDFLAVMSHELRTPLNAIIGYGDLLELGVGGGLAHTQREYLSRMRGSAEQLLTLIDQILSLSRIEAGKEEVRVESVDGGTTVREAAALVMPAASKKALTLDVAAPAAPLWIETDRGKLRQILLNLLSNAVKFTAEGSIALAVRAGAVGVEFSVRDTGVGIEAHDFERIFRPFEQVDSSASRRYGGSGLGLSVSRDLARALGGELTVESMPGKGSTFTLRLPLQHPAPLT